jgi:hypothetical protein
MWLKSHASKKFGILALAVTLGVLPGPTAHAVEIAIEPPTVEYPVMLWQFLTGSLVFLMPPGLAMLATGLTRAKNASHTAFMTFFRLRYCNYRFLDRRVCRDARRQRLFSPSSWQ